ncbi:MAG: DUF6339 family protein [Chloroflexota bacterium]|nr:DUF6339 family protein [Chloroflexota bacterium]
MSGELYYLYPRLPQHVAQQAAAIIVTQTAHELIDLWQTSHDEATYAPTGGNRITTEQLKLLRAAVLTVAQRYGYPDMSDKSSARAFDVECAILLHETMHLHPSEASHNEVWSFLGCILLPDVVRWRFDDSMDAVRFVGRERGMRRHAFGRLWWRAYLACNPRWEKPYELLRLLNEDDLVQVTERSSIAVRPALFRSFCVSFAMTAKSHADLPRRDLMREASKRMYRLLSLTAVEALSEQELRMLTDDVFTKTAEALINVIEMSS